MAADWSYPFEVFVNNIRFAKFVDDLPSRVDWFYDFMDHHKGEISMKKSQNINRVEVDSNQAKSFFNQLKGVWKAFLSKILKTNLTDDPVSVKVMRIEWLIHQRQAGP